MAEETNEVMQSRPAIETLIVAHALSHGIPLPVARALVDTESGFNPRAYKFEQRYYNEYILNKPRWMNNPYYSEPRRISASYGLTQILYTTALYVGLGEDQPPEALFDPGLNLDLGFRYWVYMLHLANQNVELAYLKYNGGPGRTPSDSTAQNRENTARFMRIYRQASI